MTMKRYRNQRRRIDRKLVECALKFYEPHLSAETRRKLEGEEKAAKRTEDETRCFVDTSNDSIS